MEDYAYVLDVLPEGRPDSKRRFRREAVVYGLGIEEHFQRSSGFYWLNYLLQFTNFENKSLG